VKGHAVELQRDRELFDASNLPLFSWQTAPKHRYVRIEPVQITGRRFHPVDPSFWTESTAVAR